MKKILLYLFAAGYLLTSLASCEKDAADIPLVNNKPITDTATIKLPPAPSTPGSGNNSSNSYQPLTAGSYWKYTYTYLKAPVDTGTTTMSNKTMVLKGKTYYEVNQVSKNFGPQKGYFYSGNHNYAQRGDTFINGVTVEILYLNDTTSVGNTWTAPFTDNGLVNNVPARIFGKVLEKGITKTVLGKTFNNVIHTSAELQYNLINGFETAATYHFYIAKGVGVIENYSILDGQVASSAKLFEYSIK